MDGYLVCRGDTIVQYTCHPSGVVVLLLTPALYTFRTSGAEDKRYHSLGETKGI